MLGNKDMMVPKGIKDGWIKGRGIILTFGRNKFVIKFGFY